MKIVQISWRKRSLTTQVGEDTPQKLWRQYLLGYSCESWWTLWLLYFSTRAFDSFRPLVFPEFSKREHQTIIRRIRRRLHSLYQSHLSSQLLNLFLCLLSFWGEYFEAWLTNRFEPKVGEISVQCPSIWLEKLFSVFFFSERWKRIGNFSRISSTTYHWNWNYNWWLSTSFSISLLRIPVVMDVYGRFCPTSLAQQ